MINTRHMCKAKNKIIILHLFHSPIHSFHSASCRVISFHVISCMHSFMHSFNVITLPKTNIAPWNRPSQKETSFQPSLFRCYANFREGKSFQSYMDRVQGVQHLLETTWPEKGDPRPLNFCLKLELYILGVCFHNHKPSKITQTFSRGEHKEYIFETTTQFSNGGHLHIKW